MKFTQELYPCNRGMYSKYSLKYDTTLLFDFYKFI